jgi:hypothetical protein
MENKAINEARDRAINGDGLASDVDDAFLMSRLATLNKLKTDQEKRDFINKLYQEGYEDGVNDKENIE